MRFRGTLVAAVAATLTMVFAAAAQAAVVTDSFTGTNGTLLENHTGETGATWTFHSAYPNHLTIQSNRVYAADWSLYFPSGVPATNEYDVSADLTVLSNTGAIGVVGRSLTTGSDSLYMGRYNAGTTQWELVKCTSAACTVLASTPETLAIGSTYAIRLEIRDAAKKLFVNGVQKGSSTDNTITQVGRAGIRVGPGGSTTTTGYHLDNFSVVAPAAETSITGGPSGLTNNASPSFSFTSTPSGGTFECRLDGPAGAVGTWGACNSAKTYASLANGAYTFNVRATVGGVTDSTPATRSFTVDTTPPDTTITSGPTGTINTSSTSFGFSSETGATFQCKLDGPGTATGTYGSCSSPKAYASLANGSYTFSVRATDTAGNVDASPATRAFTVSVSGCSLNLAALSVSGCSLLKSDNSTVLDPNTLWGNIECVLDSRHQQVTTGGDTHATGDGSAQGDTAFRRMTVLDGDDYYGERCELGINEHRTGFTPTFHLYREGEHKVTFFSMRLPSNFPVNTPDWQVVMQMKQTQPADNGNGTPVLSLDVEGGQWKLFQSDSILETSGGSFLWTTPAANSVWTRFAWDVTYSQNSSLGKVKVYADLNNDGDALDTGEQSPQFTTYTMKRETAAQQSPDNDPLVAGDSIPSHLRMGVYHNPVISCPAPSGCSVETDNVQVFAGP